MYRAPQTAIMKISIIILSFNNYDETTGQCLNFLSFDPDFSTWEVIVVDNASDPLTQQMLSEMERRYTNVNVIFNDSNLGFSAGNNVGIKLATGDFIVLLNSDAFAPSGMINRLVLHLADDSLLGMIGPVTNAAGNEQRIFTAEGDVEKVIREGLVYTDSGGSEVLSASRLDFFCVAIPRRVLEQIGLLDEDFGRGYFEDLDYSLRVKSAGYELGVAEDCFVYHRGSASFGKIPHQLRELIKRNKQLILRKHGRGVLFQHRRQANLSLLSQYVASKRPTGNLPEYRISNRLILANTDLPRSWFKRWRYLRNVKTIAIQTAMTDK